MLTIIVAFSIVLFSKLKIFDIDNSIRILKITIPENLDYTDMFDDIFKKFVKEFKLQSVRTTNMGSLFELNYHIVFKKDINEKEFIDEIRVRNGNLKVMLGYDVDGTEM